MENMSHIRVLTIVLVLLMWCKLFSGEYFKVALLAPYNCSASMGMHVSAGAVTIALEEIRREWLSEEHNISLVWRDTQCNPSLAAGYITELYGQGVDVVFGDPMSEANTPVGLLTSFWNLPHVSWVAGDYHMVNKAVYTTLIRTRGRVSLIGDAIIILMREYGWTKAGLIFKNTDRYFNLVHGIEVAFEQNNITTADVFLYESKEPDEEMADAAIDRITEHTTIIIIATPSSDERTFMLRMYDRGLVSGAHVFITLGRIVDPDFEPWKVGDAQDWKASLAYRHALDMLPFTGPNDTGFRDFVAVKSADEPFFYDWATNNNVTGSAYSSFLHDSILLYGIWLNHTLENGLSARDGRGMFEFTKNLSFEGRSGLVHFDNNGDRELHWLVRDFSDPDGEPRSTSVIHTDYTTDKRTLAFEVLKERRWLTADGNPPRDTPGCDTCDEENIVLNIGLPVVLTLLASILAGIALSYYRVRKRQAEIAKTAWKVDIDQLKFSLPKTESMGTFRSISPRSYLDRSSHTSLGTHAVSFNSNYAVYKGEQVYMKRFNRNLKKHFQLTKWVLTDLRQMKDLSHESINGFIGALFDSPDACILFKFCQKGSLQMLYDWEVAPSCCGCRKCSKYALSMRRTFHCTEQFASLIEQTPALFTVVPPFVFIGSLFYEDNLLPSTSYISCTFHLKDVLENDTITLDWMFKYSFLRDIVAGMQYLHSTKLKSHGRLSSSNCVLDGRWLLKITDYIPRRLNELFFEDTVSLLDKHLLWTAPEILRMENLPERGTQKGDVYSFAIILHEIYFRMGTFPAEDLEASEIVSRVRDAENPVFRPEIPVNHTVSPQMLALLDFCWVEKPDERLTFEEIRKYIKQHNKDQKGGMLDLMVKKLEKYACNLEDLVEQRTKELSEEKKKTDRLLNRMLPPSIADKLKKGETIEPEYFQHVTIFFSDIVGFTTISAGSTPHQVVDLLNDLYTMFDEIIARYDTYKVETIGDAYMVVSGLPVRNGDIHVGEIAHMSLDILEHMSEFRIRHLPRQKLTVRIGMHTGPCCAGVVGLCTPRYCLFGDTVNTASRMESSGQSMKIQMTEHANTALQNLGGYNTSLRGEIPVKGKGIMTTYWLLGKKEAT